MPKPRGSSGLKKGVEFQVSPWHDKRDRVPGSAQQAERAQSPHAQVKYVPMLGKAAAAAAQHAATPTETQPVLQLQRLKPEQLQPQSAWVTRSKKPDAPAKHDVQQPAMANEPAGPGSTADPMLSSPQHVQPDQHAMQLEADAQGLQGMTSGQLQDDAAQDDQLQPEGQQPSSTGPDTTTDAAAATDAGSSRQVGITQTARGPTAGSSPVGTKRPRITGRGGGAGGAQALKSRTLTWGDSDSDLELEAAQVAAASGSSDSGDETEEREEEEQQGKDQDMGQEVGAHEAQHVVTGSEGQHAASQLDREPTEACPPAQVRVQAPTPVGVAVGAAGAADGEVDEKEQQEGVAGSGSCGGLGRIARLPGGSVSGHLVLPASRLCYGVMGTRVSVGCVGCVDDDHMDPGEMWNRHGMCKYGIICDSALGAHRAQHDVLPCACACSVTMTMPHRHDVMPRSCASVRC